MTVGLRGLAQGLPFKGLEHGWAQLYLDGNPALVRVLVFLKVFGAFHRSDHNTNGAPLSGALFVSNPRKRKKLSRKAKRKTAPKRRNRRNTAAAASRRASALKTLRNRRNAKRSLSSKKAATTRRRNALALKTNRSKAAKKAAATRRRNRRNGTKKTMQRKTARKAYMKTNRRNGTRKHMVRKTARRAYTKRRNTNAMSAFGSRLSAPLQRLVGKVPVVGSLAKQYVAPLVMGAVAGAVHYYSVKALQQYAPAIAEKIQPVQFTLTGSLVAGILLMGGKIPLLKKVSAKTRQQVAAAALILGGGLDSYRYLSKTMGDLGDTEDLYDFGDEVSLYNYSGLGVDLGDGMAYDVVPLPQDMGGALLSGDEIDYAGAEFGDAHAAPDDLSVEEGEAALAGPRRWRRRWGHMPRRRQRVTGYYSQMAGEPGHRFGWLIKLVGFDNFQKIAALPPAQRVSLVAQMKAQAIALANEQAGTADAGELSGLGVDYSGLGVDLGATMHAGSVL